MLKNSLRIHIILLLLILVRVVSGQEMTGYVHSNYAGITGSFINPASILNSKLYLDINLIGLQLHVDNNYVYLAKDEYRFSRFLEKDPQFPEHIHPITGESKSIYDYYNTDLKNAYSQIRVMGPSAMYALGNQAFGISTSFRTIVSGHQLPYDLAKFAIDGLRFYPQHRINYIDEIDFRASGMAFTEIAGTYSFVISRYNQEHWSAGITVKALLGSAGVYGFGDNIDYLIPNADTIIVYKANGSVGVSMPVDYANNDVLLPRNFVQGFGLGADIGIMYQKKIQGHSTKAYSSICEIPFQQYFFRFGASLLDVGSIKFRRNTRMIEFEDAHANMYNVRGKDFRSVNDLLRTISYEFSGDSNAMIRESAFSIALPSAVSLQADVRVMGNFYINSSVIHPLVFKDAALVRPAQVSLTPRIESRILEFALPFTLYDYRYPQLGLSARFHNIVIGTDKLGGFFGMNDFTGLDFYVMVKLQNAKGHCGGKAKFGCGNLEYRSKY